jgi:hypothetical protein
MPEQPMSVQEQILALEEGLRQAELGPDPAFFERVANHRRFGLGSE